MRPATVTVLASMIVAAAGVAAAPALAAGAAYAGKWGVAPAHCRLPQDTIDAPVLMRARSYDNFETRCDFSKVTNVRAGVWKMRAKCESAGEVSNDRLTVWANAKSMTWKWASAAEKFHFSRCK
jgi:hypothetical protein